MYQPGDCTNQGTYSASCTVLTISIGWNTLHELGTERGVCINQEIVLTRVLTQQVVLYLLSVLVGILYMS